MIEGIPDWAVEKAHGLLKVECGLSPSFERYTRTSEPVKAFARYIAINEAPPADPDEVAVIAIVQAFMNTSDDTDFMGWDIRRHDLQAALAVYREHKA